MPSAADFSIQFLDDEIFDVFADYMRGPAPGDGNLGAPLPEIERIRRAIGLPLGAAGWRRFWVLRAPDGGIHGHVDLRGHPVPAAAHRCLIGVSVDLSQRRRGWGSRLMAQAEAWLLGHSALEWLDLQVLAINDGALRLYLAGGYAKVGEIAEMFKVDGQYFSFISMSKKLYRPAPL